MRHSATCLVTGATSGIGRATAQALAGMGRSLVILGRDPSALEAVSAEIRARTGNDAVEVLHADLGSLDSIRHAADRFKVNHDRLDVLINNAGLQRFHRTVTVDGFETTFAVNYLAPFLLTNLLLDVLERSAPSRIVNVTSTALRRGRIDFEDLQGVQRFEGMQAYNNSKLAIVLFTYELARRLEGTGVTANCVHPGVVRTNMGHGERPPLRWRLLITLSRPFMRTPEQGARTSVYAATAAELEGVSGRFFANGREARTSESSYGADLARRWRPRSGGKWNGRRLRVSANSPFPADLGRHLQRGLPPQAGLSRVKAEVPAPAHSRPTTRWRGGCGRHRAPHVRYQRRPRVVQPVQGMTDRVSERL